MYVLYHTLRPMQAQLTGSRCAALGGFSLHAGTACGPNDRERLEQLCRYVTRPAIAMDRLAQQPDGLLIYKLKRPYQDGTEYLLFSPEELLEKLAALVRALTLARDPAEDLAGTSASAGRVCVLTIKSCRPSRKE